MKKIIFAGKFDGDENKLPHKEPPAGSVPFKEPDMKKFALISNIGSCVVMLPLIIAAVYFDRAYLAESRFTFLLAFPAAMLTLFPHEILHALCFRETACIYTNLEKGMLFVVGTEDMSKLRFVLMSLCPNIVFGLIPFVVGIVFPKLMVLSVMGAGCIGMGFGDYINVFHAVTQMPKGAKTYLNGFHSYWYIDDKQR